MLTWHKLLTACFNTTFKFLIKTKNVWQERADKSHSGKRSHKGKEGCDFSASKEVTEDTKLKSLNSEFAIP